MPYVEVITNVAESVITDEFQKRLGDVAAQSLNRPRDHTMVYIKAGIVLSTRPVKRSADCNVSIKRKDKRFRWAATMIRALASSSCRSRGKAKRRIRDTVELLRQSSRRSVSRLPALSSSFMTTSRSKWGVGPLRITRSGMTNISELEANRFIFQNKMTFYYNKIYFYHKSKFSLIIIGKQSNTETFIFNNHLIKAKFQPVTKYSTRP